MNDALTLFNNAAGVAATNVSLLIRTLIMVSMLLWAAWCLKHFLQQLHLHGFDIERELFRFGRLLFLLVLCSALVYIA